MKKKAARSVLNILFIAVFATVLFCVIGTKVLDKTGVEFPSWINAGAEKSYLEGSNYQAFPDLTMSAVLSGTFQEETESWAADSVPNRDEILLANASLQRLSIKSANLLMNYKYYPTYYGSNYAYCSTMNRILEMPKKHRNTDDTIFFNIVNGIKQTAIEHSDKRFYYYLPARSETCSPLISEDYVSDAISQLDYIDTLTKHFDNKLQLISSDPTVDEFDRFYFKTDHHWNIIGAYEGFIAISNCMGSNPKPADDLDLIVYNEPIFYGSGSRTALYPNITEDRIMDYVLDLPDFSVKVNGTNRIKSAICEQYSENGYQWDEHRFIDRHGEYFHGDYGEIILETNNEPNGKTLLIVGDSFSNCIERYFLQDYSKIYILDPRHSDIKLDDYLELKEDIEDVLFIMSSTSLRAKNIESLFT